MLRRFFCITLVLLLCSLVSAAAFAEQIRVALVRGQATAEISCDDEFEVSDGVKELVLPKGKYFLHVQQGKLRLSDEHIFGSKLFINGLENKALPQVNKRSYRGNLEIFIEEENILIVNELELEDYLASVLPAKTMSVWPDEVIKAQAVAARSYALNRSLLNSSRAFDLPATDEELYYAGSGERIEKEAITRLIVSTAGQYLADAYGRPIAAVTTSSSGGLTESAENFSGKNISYLQSVRDYDDDSPEYTWEQRIAPVLLQGLLEQQGYAVGRLNSIRLSPMDEPGTDRTSTGRVKYVIFSGELGTVKITGRQLAKILMLNSPLFDIDTGTPAPETLQVPIEDRYGFQIGSKDIDIKIKADEQPVWKNLLRSYHLLSGGKDEKIIFRGRGKGSGVGLSAWGARGMANADAKDDYRTILSYYYPGTHIVY